MTRRKVLTLPVVLTEHVFDKIRSIVTVYEPDPDRWSHDYRRRRR